MVHPVHTLSFYNDVIAVSSYPDFVNTLQVDVPVNGLFAVWQVAECPKLVYVDEGQAYQHVRWLDATRLALCGFDGYLTVFSWETRRPVARWRTMARPLVSSHTATRLALGLADGTIAVYTHHGQLLVCFHAHECFVKDLSFHPHGPFLCSAGADGRICVHDLREVGKSVIQITRTYSILQACCFHPSLDLLLFSDHDDMIKGCHPTDVRSFSYHRHQATITSLACTKTHAFMSTVGMDGTLCMCSATRLRGKYIKPLSVRLLQLSQTVEGEVNELHMDDTIVSETIVHTAGVKSELNFVRKYPLDICLFTVDWNHESQTKGHWIATGGHSGLVVVMAAPSK